MRMACSPCPCQLRTFGLVVMPDGRALRLMYLQTMDMRMPVYGVQGEELLLVCCVCVWGVGCAEGMVVVGRMAWVFRRVLWEAVG